MRLGWMLLVLIALGGPLRGQSVELAEPEP